MANALDMNLRYLKGIGEARAALFAGLGIFTIGGLLSYFPRTYERWQAVPIMGAPVDTTLCIKAIVCSEPAVFKQKNGNPLVKISVTDGPGIVDIYFFNNKYVAEQLKEGETYLFYGKLSMNDDGIYEMLSPQFENGSNPEGYRPVYALTAGLKSRMIAKAVKTALDSYADEIPEVLPKEQLEKYRLPGEKKAVQMIHFPQSENEIVQARRRLIYEELLILQLGLKASAVNGKEKTEYVIRTDYSREFANRLPFSLTSAQIRSVKECIEDMQKNIPMRRLIQGDVGSGKTAVAASVIYTAVKNGFQCVVMAPTEVLARQHDKTFRRFYENTGIRVALLTGSTPLKERKEILEELITGEINLLIGTNAVISEDVHFAGLGLCITDEQHRFGVRQRSLLRSKGHEPHVLVMSATPIPRTLSLIIYGDLSISVLDEKPKGRLPVKTYCVPSSLHERIYSFLRKQMDMGNKVYLVCPLVEENENGENTDIRSNRVSAVKLMEELGHTAFIGYKTALIHGKMKQKEKETVMRAFVDGNVQLLICTVVIEVGIDVPEATVIVIENAECFGLSQLHQLRGRTGRGERQSYCIMISDAENRETKERLNIMCRTDDGFRIAEEDLKLRGPGDFFGNRQSGLPALKIADLMADTGILYAARDEAARILAEDGTLSLPKNAGLKKKSERLFADIS